MAIDYDKIFAGMASRDYEWTDTDYRKGMETMGDDPPIRQIFDALFKYQDKKMQDLNNRLKAIESVNSQHNIIPRQTEIGVGFIGHYDGMPPYMVAVCTVAGETAESIPDLSNLTYKRTMEEITDGDAVFKTRLISMMHIHGVIVPLMVKTTEKDKDSGAQHPVFSPSINAPYDVTLYDYVVLDGTNGLVDLSGRTLRGTKDPSKVKAIGGLDEITLSKSQLPDEEVLIKGTTVTNEITSAAVGQLITKTSTGEYTQKLKIADGTETTDENGNVGLATKKIKEALTESDAYAPNMNHTHTINTEYAMPPHNHTMQISAALGEGQPVRVTNPYMNVLFVGCIF